MAITKTESENRFRVQKFLYGGVESYALLVPCKIGKACHIVRGDSPDNIVRLHDSIVKAIDAGVIPEFKDCTFSEITTAANARRIELAIITYDKALDAESFIDILSALPIGSVS